MSEQNSPSSELKPEKKSTSAEGRRILVVDDEPGIRTLLEQKLSKAGFRVDIAANGLHALQKLRAGNNPPHLVICDIKMPGMNAGELLDKIRSEQATKHLPFLIMTAYADKALIMSTVRHGVSDVMIKPFAHDELMAKIQAIFSKPAAAPAA